MALTERLSRLIDPYAPADGPPPRTWTGFARWALSGAWRAIALSAGIIVLAAFSEVATAWLTGWAIDRAEAAGTGAFWAPFWPVLLVGAAFFLVLRPALFAADAGVTSILLGPHLFPLVMARVHRHTLGQSMRFFEDDFAGRIAQKEMQTANALTQVVVEVLDIGLFAIAMFVGAMLVIGGLDPRLLAVVAIWGVVYLATVAFFIPRVRRKSKARADARSRVTGQIVDTITNISTVKLFSDGATEDTGAVRALETLRRRSVEFGVLSVWFRFTLTALSGVLPFASIAGALWLWSRGAVTAGDIAAVAMVATRLGMVSHRLGRAAVMIYANVGEVQDGVDTLSRAHEIVDRPGPVTAAAGVIRFENVHFAYGGDTAALRGIDLTIREGEKLALVGASGAGKSTLVALLLRLYDVEEGRVTIAGRDIRDMPQAGVRSLVSVVRQDVAMFNRSARDNILYGRPDAAETDLVDAARRAGAHDFILGLRDHRGRKGYDAHLGERGVKLSGGQRQRIALARAILKDTPILVLDEATSALDSEVEAEIQAALRDVMAGKTVIAIAHRLSTIAQMDRIVVLDEGRIVEDGTHDGLLAEGGLYARFWSRQSGGFIAANEAAE